MEKIDFWIIGFFFIILFLAASLLVEIFQFIPIFSQYCADDLKIGERCNCLPCTWDKGETAIAFRGEQNCTDYEK